MKSAELTDGTDEKPYTEWADSPCSAAIVCSNKRIKSPLAIIICIDYQQSIYLI
jgi:hypothetical protein